VAKEYAASQVDEKGTLILSEFAGAAEEMEGSLLVNPYDIDSFADTIKEALEMPLKDRAARMSVLRRQVREHDIYRWIADILEEMVSVATSKYKKNRHLLERMDWFMRRAPLEDLFLFLDYDGTLTPIVDTPDMAIISDEVKDLVRRISTVVPVALVSGRELEDLKGKVGLDGIIYAGNHGAEIWGGESISIRRERPREDALMNEFLSRLTTELEPIDGAVVENKFVTASIHFRHVRTRDLADFFDRFSRVAEDYEESFRVTSGKKVFEIRPLDAWNKGDAVTWIAEQRGEGRIPVYVGDDTTDEDAYRALKGKGVSVSVGINPIADYYLKSQQEVAILLKDLAEHLGV
jgi:trehalose-phosphatase